MVKVLLKCWAFIVLQWRTFTMHLGRSRNKNASWTLKTFQAGRIILDVFWCWRPSIYYTAISFYMYVAIGNSLLFTKSGTTLDSEHHLQPHIIEDDANLYRIASKIKWYGIVSRHSLYTACYYFAMNHLSFASIYAMYERTSQSNDTIECLPILISNTILLHVSCQYGQYA